ncbi:MAG: hypothetical protein ACE5J9_11735 [Methanosarcinales archaeon]
MYNKQFKFYFFPILFLFLLIAYVAIAVNYPILKVGGDDYWFWIQVKGVWRDPNMFQTSLNQYFFDSELSNFPTPLFALMVPIIVFL